MSAKGSPVSGERWTSPWIGPLAAVTGVLGFSFKGILIKLAYAATPVDALSLLALRMIYSAPFFVAIAYWAGRRADARPFTSSDWRALAGLGFLGYYLASLLDFEGLRYIGVSLERLVLFLNPTIVVVLSALLLGKPITRRAVAALVLSYAGLAVVMWNDLRVTGDTGAIALGTGLVFGSAVCYALYLVWSGEVIVRIGSGRFIAWAMLASTAFVLVHFLLARPLPRSPCRRAYTCCRSRWPLFPRCCRCGSSPNRSAGWARTGRL